MPKIAKSFALKLLTFDRSTSPNKYALSDDPEEKRQNKFLLFFVRPKQYVEVDTEIITLFHREGQSSGKRK